MVKSSELNMRYSFNGIVCGNIRLKSKKKKKNHSGNYNESLFPSLYLLIFPNMSLKTLKTFCAI